MTRNFSHKLLACFLVCSASPSFAIGDADGMKTFEIRRTDTPPTIDGKIDDAVWQDAMVVQDFHQIMPHYREAPTEETLVRVLYDDDYLYISADLRDS